MGAGTWDCEVCATPDQPITGRAARGFRTSAGGREFVHPPYHVCQCVACGVYRKTARVGDAELERYYELLDFETFENAALMPPDRLVVAAARTLPAGSRILDYGCGVGRSLAPSTDRHQCFGVEPNGRAAALAASRGITLVDAAALEGAFAGSFDLVVASDVYEHLPRPAATVRRLAACLKPGGSLILVTGFADGVRPRELLAEFWYFRIVGHLHMVSERHLRWLAAEARLALESHRTLSHYDPSPLRDLLQRFRLWAYATTHLAPSGTLARLVARLPVVGRAALWSNAPMHSGGADHVFAVFRKSRD